MKQVTVHAPNDVRVSTIPTPTISANDVLVKVAACGVCGTDLTFIKRGGLGLPNAAPMALGHEASGTVVEVGDNVSNIEPGMQVIINPMLETGVIGNGAEEGAFCDYLIVRNARLNQTLYPLPAGMTLERAALVEPLSVAQHGVNRGNPGPGDKCVVFGAGPIGQGAVMWLSERGVKDIVSVDISEHRLQAAQKMGASHTLLAGKDDLRASLAKIHGEGFSVFGPGVGTDVFFDFAGAPSVIPDILEIAKQGARIAMVAIYSKPVAIDFERLVGKEISLLGSLSYPDEFAKVIEDLARLGEKVDPLISHRVPFANVLEAFDLARTPQSNKVMVAFD